MTRQAKTPAPRYASGTNAVAHVSSYYTERAAEAYFRRYVDGTNGSLETRRATVAFLASR